MSAVYQWDGMYRGGVASRGHPICEECCLPHTPERRMATLRRMLPCSRADVLEAWPHLWAESKSGRELLRRDLRDLGATRTADGVWRLS